ncbi:MAG: tetratricopeptide (TPR) repeat protein [Cyclobacteriaceae bacterium]|jgi:tetratricopeptide (TPR) repeat protein
MKGLTNASMYIVALSISLALMLPNSALGEQAQGEAAMVAKARTLIDAGSYGAALSYLQSSTQQFEESSELLGLQATVQYQLKNYGEAKQLLQQSLAISDNPRLEVLLSNVMQRFEKLTVNKKMAVIVLQKETDAGNYATAIAVARLAIQKFPNDELLYTAYGRALLEASQLDEAEIALRTALQLNPKNVEARKLIEEIRATGEAQTSEEMAEWISIAKDKVGDFIVTFLALFAAFLTSSLLAPIALRFKLGNARKAFEEGKYDDFTDLIEGLLDEENFVPLRANFRFMLAKKTYTEAQQILNKYVNTLERLPTLLRILEREHEKLNGTE